PQMDAGHNEFGASDQITWSFRSGMPNAFFGYYISGCQRLPNGNTLIDSGPSGHFFEVTKEGEVVWEYINPVGDRTNGEYGIYKIMNDATKGAFNATFRCHRYGINYPGLKGKVLTPKGKVTEVHSGESAAPPLTIAPKVPLGATPVNYRPPRPGSRPAGPPGSRPRK
ncbi:hypothetical protein ACFLZT_07345, partial [Thermodesulfobacteriota bacterium]